MNQDARQRAWRLLEESVVTYRGQPVGTVAAHDPETDALNYDQVFTRDFAISAFAFLLDDRPEIVRHFLTTAMRLQSHERQLDCFKPGEGLIPASFKVTGAGADEELFADFGEHAIARVAPVDSGFWWLLTLQAYVHVTDDRAFLNQAAVQQAIRLVLDLSMTSRFDMFPTMLVPDGSFMIDRRMGVYGYPIDIQAQFFAALCAASELLDAQEPENARYRYFGQGNLFACAAGLATEEQAGALMQLIAQRYDDLIGQVPLKLCFPALEGQDWRILTGCDPKNRPWSYHNGGNWPVLLWLLALVGLRSGADELVERALSDAERRLVKDDWPEYYDGRRGRLVGRQARRRQTWSAAGYLVACQLLERPERTELLHLGRAVEGASCAAPV